jgi:hypothetical protein
MNHRSMLRNLGLAAALVTSIGANAASIFVQAECGSGSPSACNDPFAPLQQNGPSDTLHWSSYYEGETRPIDFDFAYVGDTLVITAAAPNAYASEPYFGYDYAVYDGSKPIKRRCYYCSDPAERLGNALAHIDVYQFPRDPAHPLVIALPAAVPEVQSPLLALLGLGMVAFYKRRSRLGA